MSDEIGKSAAEYPEVRAALIAKLQAETHKAEAEALLHEEVRREQAVAARQVERVEKETLAADKFHQVYVFDTPVMDGSVSACIKQLTTWMRNNPASEIEIIFNSPGGSIVAGMALFDFIQMLRIKGHKVTTTALGMAASMAGILLQAGDVRVMGKESYLLIHEASFGAIGKVGEVEDTVALIKMMLTRVKNIFAARSHLSAKQIENRWRRKDWWLDSDEALKLGFVDEVR